MCQTAPVIQAPPRAPMAPPTLDQLAPKQATDGTDTRRKGLSKYKIALDPAMPQTNKLGGIPMKTGV